jgi:hypothetical protein
MLVEASLLRRHEWSYTDKWPKGISSFRKNVPFYVKKYWELLSPGAKATT